MEWTDLAETIVRENGERASVMRTLHTIQAQALLHTDRLLFIPSLMCSIASAAIQTTVVDSDGWRYTAAGLAVVAGTLAAANKHLQLSEQSNMHRHAASAYATAHGLATAELALSRSERICAKTLLTDMRQSLDATTKIAPVIDRKIVTEFMRTFENQDDIALPDICNEFKRILIRDDSDVLV